MLTVHDPSCTQVACDDNDGPGFLSTLDLTAVAAGTYAVSVAAYSVAEEAAFTINVSGVAVANASCTSPLFAAGVRSCAAGQTCTAGVCQ